MISIIVYGRNDERGYGMHKRVAISLNAMAQMLTAPTSEILFVDYNTPDHLPALPELLRDDLTEDARKRVRVLRVRPSVHACFAHLTPLPVLEPIARNIALRRSRSQNTWILSTNTDSVISVPDGRSLCELAAMLEGSHYGAPRFELPERVWETFDRRDPRAIIAASDMWSEHARLRETVRGEGSVQFDAPGDFQLVRRADLFAIDGFDEDALLGWHIDHNLAQRMKMLRGDEGSLAGLVNLYHCGHARRATQTHNAERIENDVARFVHGVRDPDLPGQRDLWGRPDDMIEEVDLCESPGAALLGAMEAAASPIADTLLDTIYSAQSFDALAYNAGHVAAHLLDLLSTFPRDTSIAYAGCRVDTLHALMRGLSSLGFTRRLAVPRTLVERLGVAQSSGLEAAGIEDIAAGAGLFLFEFGLVRDESGHARDPAVPVERTDEEEDALAHVTDAYRACIEAERQAARGPGSGRLFVTIGAVHSQFEPMVESTLAATPSPFTTRLRYGVVRSDSQTGVQAQTTARHSPADISSARAALARLRDPEAAQASRLEIASQYHVIQSMIAEGVLSPPDDLDRDAVRILLNQIASPPDDLAGLAHANTLDGGKERGLSALASTRDWENPEWLAWARKVTHSGQRGSAPRTGWVWQRAQLLHGLSRTLAGRSAPRALILAEHPDTFVADAGQVFSAIDLADIRDLFPGDGAPLDNAGRFSAGVYLPASRYRVIRLDEATGGYDAIILPHAAAFRNGVAGLAQLAARLIPLLSPGGVLALAGEVALTGSLRGLRPDLDAAANGMRHMFSRFGGLALTGGIEPALDPIDAALTGTVAEVEAGRPVLGVRTNGDVLWPAVWLFEASGASDPTAWRALNRDAAGLVAGELLATLTLTERAHRNEGAIIGRAGEGSGHVFYGPFLRLPPGDYGVILTLSATASGSAVAEVGAGPNIVAQTDIALGPDGPLSILLKLTIQPVGGGTGLSPPCEVRLWTSGDAEIRVTSALLEVF